MATSDATEGRLRKIESLLALAEVALEAEVGPLGENYLPTEVRWLVAEVRRYRGILGGMAS